MSDKSLRLGLLLMETSEEFDVNQTRAKVVKNRDTFCGKVCDFC